MTERAKNLTHEVLEKLRHSLDAEMRRAWERVAAPQLTQGQRQRARVYFPIADDPQSFQSTLGRAEMGDLTARHRPLYDLLLAHQPFTSADNRGLPSSAICPGRASTSGSSREGGTKPGVSSLSAQVAEQSPGILLRCASAAGSA